MIPRPTVIDLETFAIAPRPAYPPIPVGVAIKRWGEPSRYYGFGHAAEDNNAVAREAIDAVAEAYANPDGVLFHNAKFDLDVIETFFGLAPPPWDCVHESVFLLFLDDPNQKALGLKPAAARLLSWAPEERDALADWLIRNQPVDGVKIGRAAGGKHPPGAYVAFAPVALAGPYACGDVDRTAALFAHLWPKVAEAGMLPAYDRERRLLPVLLDMERRGVAVDLPALTADVAAYRGVLARLEAWTRRRLRAPTVNLGSGAQLAAALQAAGLADKAALGVTKTGRTATNKDAIATAVTDRQLAAVLRYMGALRTCLGTFMEPWEAVAKASGGRIFTRWNQTYGAGGGARTGRLSSSPNFQNIPLEFDPLFVHEGGGALPKAPFELPPLPLCRRYIRAYPGETLAGRDFNSQELRILAHFEDGDMLARYKADPAVDLHQYAADLLSKVLRLTISRKQAKVLGFSVLYGAGARHVAARLSCTINEARGFLAAYYSAFPGVRALQDELRRRAAFKLPMTTLGGRRYFCEPPATVDGQYRDFSYKMLNTIIQSSAADQTKDAMIEFYRVAGPGRLILSVHDEIVASSPPERLADDMAALRRAMDGSRLDAPVLSDGETGEHWGAMAAHA